MGAQSRTVDQIIGSLAARSHGVVTRDRLLAAGVTRKDIEARLARGSLIRLYPGVYRVGHAAPSMHATYLAAVLACGEGALLCGRAAAYLMGLIKGRTPPPPEVLTRTERRIPGITTVRTRTAVRGWTYDGIPTTTVPRTIADLASLLPLAALAEAAHHAGGKFRTTPKQVRRHLRRNAKGAGNLVAVMEGRMPVTLSALERKFLERLDEARLPRPDDVNRRVKEQRIDCRWRGPRVTVELDSYRWHNSREAFEADRRRDREAYARGDEPRRYTYGDVYEDPTLMLAELDGLLTRR